VNVISGASQTGKSAIIPIIDYCLGSDKCAIPVGRIRETTQWFGVVFETVEGQKLFARKEPGNQVQTEEMYIFEAEEIVLPEYIESRNSNTDYAKRILNRVAGITNLPLDAGADSGFYSRPSLRDMISFNFQPQNIIANPDALFFKLDSYRHREKFRNIIPYVLGALTVQMLEARWEISRLEKLLESKRREYENFQKTIKQWQEQAQELGNKAKELGLIPANQRVPDDWNELIDTLSEIASIDPGSARPSFSSLEGALGELSRLREHEAQLASELSSLRQSYNEVTRLVEATSSFDVAARIQRDRLDLAGWFEKMYTERDTLGRLVDADYSRLSSLVLALRGLEAQVTSESSVTERLDREQLRLRESIENKLKELNQTRERVNELERESEEAERVVYQWDEIAKFIGGLQKAIFFYGNLSDDSGIASEIEEVRQRIESYKEVVSEALVQQRTRNALSMVENYIGQILPSLDIEYPERPVRFREKDLTITVVQEDREDFLWEIGSGANWLGYHIATTLGFHQYFSRRSDHPVPSFIVYDQPSQVYFPRRVRADEDAMDQDWDDEDIRAVRKVFETLSNQVVRSGRRLQVIVLDHADDSVWGDIENVYLVEEWRGMKLIPEDW
jgi:hypothetical protein